jgi:hypothetical protein
MKDKTEDWMQQLVKKYKLPDESKPIKPKKILTEMQKKIILDKK